MRTLLAALIFVAVQARPVFAQIEVELSTERKEFMLHERLVTTVRIGNLAGKPLMLRDTTQSPWLRFRVENASSGNPARMRTSRPELDPLWLNPGATLEKALDLGQFYTLDQPGAVRISALVYSAEYERFFASPEVLVNIGEGRTIWSRRVGAPGGGLRVYSLLSYHIDDTRMLYARVEDATSGQVYITRPVAPHLVFSEPKAEVDAASRFNILTLSSPKTFLHLVLDPNGNQLDRVIYRTAKTQPALARTAAGAVGVVGGAADIPRAIPAGAPEVEPPARLSERPPGLTSAE